MANKADSKKIEIGGIQCAIDSRAWRVLQIAKQSVLIRSDGALKLTYAKLIEHFEPGGVEKFHAAQNRTLWVEEFAARIKDALHE